MKKNIDVKKFGKVAVLMGGDSSEREISFMSGNNILAALKLSGVDAYGIDVDKNIAEKLMQEKYDRAFVALHGRYGEDGVILGLLDYIGIPYAGSNVAASALSMDKVRTKYVWEFLGLPTAPSIVVHDKNDFELVKKKLRLPVCIKPGHEGSALGVSKVSDWSQLEVAYENAEKYHDVVMAENWIEGKEVSIGILGESPLPVVEISVPSGFYDYEAKYFSEKTSYQCPSSLTTNEEKQLQEIALKAYHAVGLQGWGRVDAMQDQSGKFWLLEINSIPGMTTHSLVPMEAKAAGISYEELVLRILETSFDVKQS